MACASQIPTHKIADKGPGTKLDPKDRELLRQPFAEVLGVMGYKLDQIVKAAKSLQSQEVPLEAATVMQEIDKLREVEHHKKDLRPLKTKSKENCDSLGSDGESEGECLEYFDTSEGNGASLPSLRDDCSAPVSTTFGRGDLQTDCAEPEAARFLESQVSSLDLLEPVKPVAKTAMSPSNGKDAAPREMMKRKISSGQDVKSLRQKLQVLRSENKRLKERQLCRECHSKPVSITFLPCGHYSFCYDCGQGFSTCPICRKTILADVKTFLA